MIDLSAIAGELYALDLADFTAERNRRARELRADHRALADAVAALPKPSASAWLVDQLVRAEPDAVEAVLELGIRLRAAHTSLDRDALRDLVRERRDLLSAAAEAAHRVSASRGRPLSGSVADEVEQTLVAAIVDDAAAAAVRSGRLARALLAVGSDPVDLAGAVAAPGEELAARAAAPRATRPSEPAIDGATSRATRALAALAAAEQGERAARAELVRHDEDLAAAVDEQERLVAEREDARAEYERLERAVGEAERRRRESIRERDRANRRLQSAERVLDRAAETASALDNRST